MIHAVDEANGVPFIVMECIDGCSLQQKIEESGPLELKENLRIGMQAADGLAAAHKQGIVHRDIKPGNILLQNGIQRVKISDFGLARSPTDVGLTDNGQILGTPLYMSPEQAMGEPINHRSDLFSLGCVLYSMCTGHAAFRARTPMAVLRRVCESEPRSIRDENPDIPAWMVEIVRKLMSKKPEDRFESASEVAALLSLHLKDLPESASIPISTTTPHRSPRLRHAWVLLACLPLIAIFAGSNLSSTSPRINKLSRIPIPDEFVANSIASAPPINVSPKIETPIQTPSITTVAGPELFPQRVATIYGGQWSTTAEELVQSDTRCTFPLILFGSQTWEDYEFSVDAMRTEGGDQFSLCFRGAHPNDFYWFGFSEWGNTLTQVGSFPGDRVLSRQRLVLENDHWYTARVRVHGNQIDGSLSEGTEVLHCFTLKDNRHSAGRVGLRTCCASFRFRNIKVTSLDGQVLWSGPPDTSGQVLQVGPVQRNSETSNSGAQSPPVREDEARPVPELSLEAISQSTGMRLALIPAGKFQMGSPLTEVNRDDNEGPLHSVQVSSFYMGLYEVTQQEFLKVMGRNPSSFHSILDQDTTQFPVEQVSWADAIEFCNRLSEADGLTPRYHIAGIQRHGDQSIVAAGVELVPGTGYRLPTEAEWEYACRANSGSGPNLPYHFGNTLNGDLANVNGDRPYGTDVKGPNLRRPSTVGSYPPNAFGLYDMHGNVWEWCVDAYDPGAYQRRHDVSINPVVISGWESRHVIRGGSYNGEAWDSRAARRFGFTPAEHYGDNGFRVVR